jgi:periplasmic protein CpxP/Spy
MKKVVIVMLLLVGMCSFAQDKKAERKALPKEKRIEMHVNKLKKDLALTDAQVASVTQLLTANAQKRDEKMAQVKEMRADSKKLSSEEKEQLKKQMEDNQMESEEQMKGILTPEQFTKWQAGREKRKEKIMQKMEEKRATK